MQFSTAVVALLSAVSAAMAADVYSTFYNGGNTDLSSDNFDVSNTGCFSLPDADSVTFSQSGSTFNGGEADGPYCLSGFSEGGCTGTKADQQFKDIQVTGTPHYGLNPGVANAASFQWHPSAC